MHSGKILKIIFVFAAIVSFFPLTGRSENTAGAENKPEPKYIVLAWNTLGMHCYNHDYQDLAVLPPFNTLIAQVIKVQEPPQVVTEGLIVEYSFPDNSYSAGKPGSPDKTNFWKYAKSLFGKDLETDKGLAGKGLSGTMDPEQDHFIAKGIPLTEYRDQDTNTNDRSTWNHSPFQLAVIIVKDSLTKKELCRTSAVAPVSNELNCAKCHADEGIATKQGNIAGAGRAELNILALHDKLNKGKYRPTLLESRPVLCARCHSSNALEMKGKSGIPSLSNAMHGRHKNVKEITPDTAGCYSCHPGNKTQCLRDVMSGEYNLNCTTCHKTMDKVALNKKPWLNEPRCDWPNCHGGGYKLDQPLYQNSRGIGNIYCAGCHDSPHAIAPSSEPNDSFKFMDLQGEKGTLYKCEVCHGSRPKGPFYHGKN
jgi:hypothetical protein